MTITISETETNRTNLILGARPVAEQPVLNSPTYAQAGDGVDRLLYVIASEMDEELDWVGTVRTVVAAQSRHGWLTENAAGRRARVFGSLVNPAMVDGHYYRSLDATGMLVRYNDAEHTGDRHLPGQPLSIISTNGDTWPVPDDGTTWTDAVYYIEVEAPEPVTATPPAAELADAHQFAADLSPEGPTRGYAKLDAQGRAPLNPTPAPGGMYLVWVAGREWTDTRLSYLGMALSPAAEGEQPGFVYSGSWRWRNGRPEFNVDAWTSGPSVERDTESLNWVEMQPVNAATNTAVMPDSFRSTAAAEAQSFEELNEALNELADDHDWCSDYESVIEPLGMNGRNKDKDWVVAVDVTFTFDDESPTGDFDQRASVRHGMDMEISNASYSATARLSIHVSDTSEQGARDYIDSNLLEDRLRSEMSHASNIDITDWDIDDVDED